jgi:hypothetical protein
VRGAKGFVSSLNSNKFHCCDDRLSYSSPLDQHMVLISDGILNSKGRRATFRFPVNFDIVPDCASNRLWILQEASFHIIPR